MIDAEDVVASVRAAFPAEPHARRDQLFNGHCEECRSVSEAFGGRPWPTISLENLLAGGETALLTAAAWRYYLPAVITWCIREPEAVDVIADNLVYQLEPPAAGKTDEWFAERKEGFNDSQREAIIGFLSWYRDRQEAEYAAMKIEPPPHVYRALGYWRGDAA